MLQSSSKGLAKTSCLRKRSHRSCNGEDEALRLGVRPSANHVQILMLAVTRSGGIIRVGGISPRGEAVDHDGVGRWSLLRTAGSPNHASPVPLHEPRDSALLVFISQAFYIPSCQPPIPHYPGATSSTTLRVLAQLKSQYAARCTLRAQSEYLPRSLYR